MSPSANPLWRRYVDALPDGINSHPECLVKGSVLRSVKDSVPQHIDIDALPEPIAQLLRHPPLPTAWISEVYFHVVMLAYQEGIPAQEFEGWVFDRNRKLLRTSLYRVLFLVVSPERLFVGMASRWSAFRRGTELSLLERSGTKARLALSFPRRLHDVITLRNMGIALRAAADAAGATNPTVRVIHVTEVSAEIVIEWG